MTARRGQVGFTRAWRIQADSPGEFVEVAETAERDRVAIAVIRGDTTERVWLSKVSWSVLTDLRYSGIEVEGPQEGQEVQGE